MEAYIHLRPNLFLIIVLGKATKRGRLHQGIGFIPSNYLGTSTCPMSRHSPSKKDRMSLYDQLGVTMGGIGGVSLIVFKGRNLRKDFNGASFLSGLSGPPVEFSV